MRTISSSVFWIAIAIVAGAGCASSSGGIKPDAQPPKVGEAALTRSDDVKKRMTRIVVSGSSGDCTATIDDPTIVGKPGKKIGWLVEDASTGCSSNENWYIELEFASAWNNGNNREIAIDADDVKFLRVHPNTPLTTPGAGHEYKVYLVYPRFWGKDIRIALIDPEVDIAM